VQAATLANALAGFPGSQVLARAKWADAIQSYLTEIVQAAMLQSTYAAVARAAFFAKVQLADGVNVPTAATDIADAWRAAMYSFVGSGAPTTFVAWVPATPGPTNVDTAHDVLLALLIPLFTTRGLVAQTQLLAVASAIHSVTFSIKFTSSTGAAAFT
jgi:hypothetical protein